MRSEWAIGLSLLLVASVAAAEIRETPPAQPESVVETSTEDGDDSYWQDFGYGTLAMITNVFYMPVKIAYAIVGLPVGGLGYVLTAGDREISDAIWGQSLGGDYVVTPKMLLGEQEIHFNGKPRE